jgi:hypothetical protein
MSLSLETIELVPATGFEPARPREDFGFKDRCVYRSATRAFTIIKEFPVAVKIVHQVASL